MAVVDERQVEAFPEHVPPPPPPPDFPLPDIGPAELAEGQQVRGGGTAVRRRFLDTLLDMRPTTTMDEAQRALHHVFGHGLATIHVAEVVRLAKELAKAHPAPAKAAAPPAPPALVVVPAPAPAPAKAPAPPAPQPDFAAAVRALAQEFRALCERHHVTSGSLTWSGGTVAISFQRTEKLEV
jgi:hypothetical protein